MLVPLWRLTSSGTKFIEVINNVLRARQWKNWSGAQGARHGFSPRPEHFLELAFDLIIDLRICSHESLVEIPTEIDIVRGSDILHNAVQHI